LSLENTEDDLEIIGRDYLGIFYIVNIVCSTRNSVIFDEKVHGIEKLIGEDVLLLLNSSDSHLRTHFN
jgi:hypothetical protein